MPKLISALSDALQNSQYLTLRSTRFDPLPSLCVFMIECECAL